MKHIYRDLALAASFLVSGPALASIILVGGVDDPNCDFTTIPAAVHEANQNSVPDVIRIAISGTYNAQAIDASADNFNDFQSIEFDGGYADCAAAANGAKAPFATTAIVGLGNNGVPVFYFKGNGEITFRSLDIWFGGVNNNFGHGGGIFYEGPGRLTLIDTGLILNQAQYGGGLFARGLGGKLVVDAKSGTRIENNNASLAGGGVYLEGDVEFFMVEPNSTIKNNKVILNNQIVGFGGGIMMEGYPVKVTIASPGRQGSAAIQSNAAHQGGGIAMLDGGKLIVATNPDFLPVTAPVRFHDNQAHQGGALYIRNQDISTSVRMKDFVLENNGADEGAAIYSDARGNTPINIALGDVSFIQDLVSGGCPDVAYCDLFQGNYTSGGSLIETTGLASVYTDRVVFKNNTLNDGDLIHLNADTTDGSSPPDLHLLDCLIARNAVTGNLVSQSFKQELKIQGCTIAANQVDSNILFRTTHSLSEIDMVETIVDQPGTVIFQNPGGSASTVLSTRHNIVHDKDSLSEDDTSSREAPARFVDPSPAYDDFTPRVGSLAVEFAPFVFGDQYDLARKTRDEPVPYKPDIAGPRDAGAYELHDIANIVPNGFFNFDTRAWELTPQVASLDQADASGTYQVPGQNSIRGMLADATGTSVITVARSCIHLPTHGDYRLTARALTNSVLADQPDIPFVEWHLRQNADQCTGPDLSSGELRFSPGEGWIFPTAEPRFQIFEAPEYGPNSTVELVLKIQKNASQGNAGNIYALFDSIVLTRVGGASNAPPVANDDTYQTLIDTPLTVPAPGVMGNDDDPDGNPIQASSQLLPQEGILVSFGADGGFAYTPNPGFEGTDTFTYQVTDTHGGAANATVTINVVSDNHVPVVADDAYSTTINTPLTIAAPGLLANDSDQDGDEMKARISQPPLGNLILSEDGAFTYQPPLNFEGTDTFTYYVFDGEDNSNTIATVTIDVASDNHKSIAADDAYATATNTALTVAAPGLLVNDSDQDGDQMRARVLQGPAGNLTLSESGTFTYQPPANFEGVDTFTYFVFDGEDDSDPAQVSITVAPAGSLPLLKDGFE